MPDSSKPWRATCIQMSTEIVWPAADRATARKRMAQNLDAAQAMIDQAMAADPKPSLILLPEYAFTGQPNGGTVAAWIDKACTPVPGPLTEPFQLAARKHGIYLGGNQFETSAEWPGRFFNTSWLIGPSGQVILRYRRVHTAQWCSPHDVLDDYLVRHGWQGLWPVVDTELGRIGMIPCGEVAVPEVLRTMALRGTEILLHPTWEIRTEGQDAAKVAGAAGNAMYIVSANVSESLSGGVVDNRPSQQEVGSGSRIIDHRGRTLASAEGHDATVDVSAMVDVGEVRRARDDTSMANPLLRLRLETVAPTYRDNSIYPPNAFLDRPMDTFDQAGLPAQQAHSRLRACLDAAGVDASAGAPASRA